MLWWDGYWWRCNGSWWYFSSHRHGFCLFGPCTKFRDGNSPYYNIDLKKILVAGKPLPLNSRVFDGKYGTVLDSGTTYAYLPEAAFVAFKEAIMKELQSLKQIRGPDPNYNDICFTGDSSYISKLSDTFPAVEMAFGNGQKLLLSPENYLFRHSKVRGAFCLGIFQNGKDPTTLLGGIIVRNTLVMYDREHSKIGFWKTNCSELWERLHVTGASPPVPSFSNGNNSITESPPRELRIGQITFQMSLSINMSDLRPHIPELSEFIAQELDDYTSQVHLLNVMSKGNNSLVTWAILPTDSASYISNATATSIYSRLSEHRVQLPDTYGNYQLLQWKIEPPANRTWWQLHYVVVLAVTITVIVALLVSGAWFIWRKRQQPVNSYKPVNVTVPEQELQPL